MENLEKIIWPIILAVLGYLSKSIYELYLDFRKKRIQNIEAKLKLFYWPILIRLEKDNAIWETILSKRNDPNSIQYKIANQVEDNIILKNHQEILKIIEDYIYLAEPNEDLVLQVKIYIKNISIYQSLRSAKEEKMFPIDLGAPWPDNFFNIIKEKTDHYQTQLNENPF